MTMMEMLDGMVRGEITVDDAGAMVAANPSWSYDVKYGESTAEINERALWPLRRHLAASAKAQRPAVATPTVRCDCGHSVTHVNVMRASTGTACPNCYDRMSEN